MSEHVRCVEFERAYPELGSLTARTIAISSVNECQAAIAELGLPVFMKGGVFSRKNLGWRACVADSISQARKHCEALLANEAMARGRVLVREVLPLKRIDRGPLEFPLVREYRVFLHEEQVLGWGYYWPALPAFATLSDEEEAGMLATALEAARRVRVPLVCVDVAQQTDDQWKVIETGDPQFSGFQLMDPLATMTRLVAACEAR